MTNTVKFQPKVYKKKQKRVRVIKIIKKSTNKHEKQIKVVWNVTASWAKVS